MKAKKLTDEQVHELDAVQARAGGIIPWATSSALNLNSIRAVIDAYEQMREPEPIAGSVVHRMLEAYYPNTPSYEKWNTGLVQNMTHAAHVLLDAVSGKVTDEEREAWNKISPVVASVSDFCHWLISRRVERMLAPERTPEERVTVHRPCALRQEWETRIDDKPVASFDSEQIANDLREGTVARMNRERGAK